MAILRSRKSMFNRAASRDSSILLSAAALFEIQADHLHGFTQARQVHQTPREVVYALFGRAELASSDRDPAPADITNETETFAGSAPKSVELATDPAAELALAFCVSPICPTTRSTASADMKQPFGAKPDRSFLLLMSWIAANHGIEGAVFVSAGGKTCRSTITRNVNFRARRSEAARPDWH